MHGECRQDGAAKQLRRRRRRIPAAVAGRQPLDGPSPLHGKAERLRPQLSQRSGRRGCLGVLLPQQLRRLPATAVGCYRFAPAMTQPANVRMYVMGCVHRQGRTGRHMFAAIHHMHGGRQDRLPRFGRACKRVELDRLALRHNSRAARVVGAMAASCRGWRRRADRYGVQRSEDLTTNQLPEGLARRSDRAHQQQSGEGWLIALSVRGAVRGRIQTAWEAMPKARLPGATSSW